MEQPSPIYTHCLKGYSMATLTRRTFCISSTAAAALSAPSVLSLPSLSIISTPESLVDPVIAAASAWLRLEPILTDLLRRIDLAYSAWDDALADDLQWEWERVQRIADEHLTVAVNTPSSNPEALEAKIRLYRASTEYYCEDEDTYFFEAIEEDIAALSGKVVS
jgi:hypothetical protein